MVECVKKCQLNSEVIKAKATRLIEREKSVYAAHATSNWQQRRGLG